MNAGFIVEESLADLVARDAGAPSRDASERHVGSCADSPEVVFRSLLERVRGAA